MIKNSIKDFLTDSGVSVSVKHQAKKLTDEMRTEIAKEVEEIIKKNEIFNNKDFVHVERLLKHYLSGNYKKMIWEIKYHEDEFLFFKDVATYLRYLYNLIIDLYYGPQEEDYC